MTISQNQFTIEPIQGQMDLRANLQTIGAQIDSAEAGTLVPGQAVTMVDSAGGVPKLIAAAAASNDIFGFLNYDIKNPNFVALDAVQVSQFRGNVMYMTASAAIARNAKVAVVIASKKVHTAASTEMIIGRALDKASADGDLIRVEIDLPGTIAP